MVQRILDGFAGLVAAVLGTALLAAAFVHVQAPIVLPEPGISANALGLGESPAASTIVSSVSRASVARNAMPRISSRIVRPAVVATAPRRFVRAAMRVAIHLQTRTPNAPRRAHATPVRVAVAASVRGTVGLWPRNTRAVGQPVSMHAPRSRHRGVSRARIVLASSSGAVPEPPIGYDADTPIVDEVAPAIDEIPESLPSIEPHPSRSRR